jgi:hypothetical protein
MMDINSIETLVGDLAAWCREEMAALPKPWAELGRIDQSIVEERLQRRAYDIAVHALGLVTDLAVGEFDQVPAILESITIKDGAKATLKLVGPKKLRLADHVGGEVRVLISPTAADLFGPVPEPKAEVQLDFMGGATANGKE